MARFVCFDTIVRWSNSITFYGFYSTLTNDFFLLRYRWRGRVRLSIPNHGFMQREPCYTMLKPVSFGSIQLLTGFPFSSKIPVPSSTWISTLKSSLLRLGYTDLLKLGTAHITGKTRSNCPVSVEPFQDVWFKSNSSLTETKIFGDSIF